MRRLEVFCRRRHVVFLGLFLIVDLLTNCMIEVSYTFTNRTPHMKLNRAAFNWLEVQVQSWSSLLATATST